MRSSSQTASRDDLREELLPPNTEESFDSDREFAEKHYMRLIMNVFDDDAYK